MTSSAPARLGLDACEHHLALHAMAAAGRFGRGALEAVELPPVSGGRVDAAALRVAAVLAWTREVEEAGLPSFVEALAEGVMRGTLLVALDHGADRLGAYWRGRHERFTAGEREELYARTLGAPGRPEASQVQPLLAAFVAELSAIGRAPTTLPVGDRVARANVAGLDLAAELTARCAGMAAFAARDIVRHLREALAVLDDPDVARALGGGGPWALIEAHGREVLGRQVTPVPHLARAAAVHALLSWLADHAAALDAGAAAIERLDPVVRAAEAWLAEEAAA